MTSTTIAALLEDLGVTRSLSRPRTSDDNPYSEANFKTVEYRPDYPDRFETINQARAWMRRFARSEPLGPRSGASGSARSFQSGGWGGVPVRTPARTGFGRGGD
jgi:transposase InsO family protein